MDIFIVLSSNVDTANVKIEWWLLLDIFISFVGIVHGNIGCTELLLIGRTVDCNSNWRYGWKTQVTYYGTCVGQIEFTTNVTADENPDILMRTCWCVSVEFHLFWTN